MLLNVALFVLGMAWLQQRAELPGLLWIYAFAAVLVVRWVRPAPVGPHRLLLARTVDALLCFAAGFLWAALVAHIKLADRLPPEWEGRDIELSGVIASLPQVNEHGTRFEFDVERVITPLAQVPRHITLTRYLEAEVFGGAGPVPPSPGERWQLSVRLRRPHGLANPDGFDFEAWLLERGIRATGYVRPDQGNRRLHSMVWRPSYALERLREWVRGRIASALPEQSSAGVLAALAIGDQQAISRDQWTVFTRTGVNHLMSISCALA